MMTTSRPPAIISGRPRRKKIEIRKGYDAAGRFWDDIWVNQLPAQRDKVFCVERKTRRVNGEFSVLFRCFHNHEYQHLGCHRKKVAVP